MKNNVKLVVFFFALVFGTQCGAQQITKAQKIAIQSDKIEQYKKAFDTDYNKCIGVKETSYSALAYSIRFGKTNIIRYLLDKNANVNTACDGYTPLMSAAQFGQLEWAKILLSKGANANAKDKNGKTAKQYAVENNHPEIAKLFSEKK